MSFEELTQKVIAIIANAQYTSPEGISLDSNFEDIGIDSLGALGIVSDIENEFQVTIPNDKAFLITNVRQLVESLEEFLGATTVHS